LDKKIMIEIRRCVQRDTDAICAIQDIIIDDIKTKTELINDLFIPLCRSELEMYFLDENTVVYGAFDEEKMVAFALGTSVIKEQEDFELIYTRRINYYIRNKKLFSAEIIAVLPDYQNRGLQKQLLHNLVLAANSTDADYVICTVSPDNVISLNNLLNYGFNIIDITAYKVGEEIYKRYFMYIPLVWQY